MQQRIAFLYEEIERLEDELERLLDEEHEAGRIEHHPNSED